MHHAPSLEGVCWIYWAQGKWRCELRRMVREAVNLLYFFVYKATCIYSTLRACKGPAKRARRLLPQHVTEYPVVIESAWCKPMSIRTYSVLQNPSNVLPDWPYQHVDKQEKVINL